MRDRFLDVVYGKFCKILIKELLDVHDFKLDKANKFMRYYVDDDGYGLFIPRKAEDKIMWIVTKDDLSIGTLEIWDYPFSIRLKAHPLKREQLIQTIEKIIEVHRHDGTDTNWKKIDRGINKRRYRNRFMQKSEDFICRRGFTAKSGSRASDSK